MNTENNYCRLCAESKPSHKLKDLKFDEEQLQEVVKKLKRLNCHLDFKENTLPLSVCFVCTNSLNHAFDFVTALEQAQTVLKDLTSWQSIKMEIEESDCVNLEYLDDDLSHDNYDSSINIIDEEYTIIKPTSPRPRKISAKCNEKKSTSYLDHSKAPLELTWKDYVWTCAYCETQFPRLTELTKHSMEHHKSCNAYCCTDCNVKKIYLDSFLIHVRKHRKYLKLSCYKCFKIFHSTYKRRKHETVHVTSDHKCNGCNTDFPNVELLNDHTKSFNKNSRSRNVPTQLHKDSLTCLKCNKTLKTKASLHAHLLTHVDKAKDHICEVCGKCFLRKYHLQRHFMLHGDNKPFQCEICKYSFRTRYQLHDHVGVHDGNKPFSCEKCGEKFRLRRQLNSHSIVHTDSFPHPCSYCNKRFRFKSRLIDHIRQHTGVKPYSCTICLRDFTNWPNYNKHMKGKHSMDMAKKRRTPEVPVDTITEVKYSKKKLLKKSISKQENLKNESDNN